MSTLPGGGLAQSIKQRLLNYARQRGEVFNIVLVRFTIERLLYRLATIFRTVCATEVEPDGPRFVRRRPPGDRDVSGSYPDRVIHKSGQLPQIVV